MSPRVKRVIRVLCAIGIAICFVVMQLAWGVILKDVPSQQSYPYFQCEDGSKMYVDPPNQTWWINQGPAHKSSEVDAAYEFAYRKCNPNISP